MRRAWIGVLAALGLLVAGCGSSTAGTPTTATDPKVIAACEAFSTAYNKQAAIIKSKELKPVDYKNAEAAMGKALDDGQYVASGDLGHLFVTARQGWKAEQAAGGLSQDDTALLIQTYWHLIDACAAAGAKATRPPT